MPTDEQIMSFTLDDPDLKAARQWIADNCRQARFDFINQCAMLVDAEVPAVDDIIAAQVANELIAARQRVDRARARYFYWRARVESLPGKES